MTLETNFIEETLNHINLDSNGHSIKKISDGTLNEKGLINLSGGIPSKEITYLTLDIHSAEEDVFEVNISTDLYDVSRTINFRKKFISNDYMSVQTPKKGIGRNLLINQVIAAQNTGFNFLFTNATAKYGEYNGYITWGKLGYTMSVSSREEFNNLLKLHDRSERTLFELLKTQEGLNFWENNGFSWSALFFLNESSENILLLKEYLRERGINVPFL